MKKSAVESGVHVRGSIDDLSKEQGLAGELK